MSFGSAYLHLNKTSIIMLLFSRTSFIFYKGMNYLNSIWVSKVVEHSFAMGWCQLKVLAVAWNIFLRNSRKCLKYLCESTVFFHSVLFVCVTLGFSRINSELSSESSAFFGIICAKQNHRKPKNMYQVEYFVLSSAIFPVFGSEWK